MRQEGACRRARKKRGRDRAAEPHQHRWDASKEQDGLWTDEAHRQLTQLPRMKATSYTALSRAGRANDFLLGGCLAPAHFPEGTCRAVPGAAGEVKRAPRATLTSKHPKAPSTTRKAPNVKAAFRTLRETKIRRRRRRRRCNLEATFARLLAAWPNQPEESDMRCSRTRSDGCRCVRKEVAFSSCEEWHGDAGPQKPLGHVRKAVALAWTETKAHRNGCDVQGRWLLERRDAKSGT
jgi:hypothetical protein